MSTRPPPAALDPVQIEQTLASEPAHIRWKGYTCELVTPLFGGGVEAGKVDKDMPIRASAIRGQLRFWWRLLAQHKWRLDNVREKEFDLWGGLDGKNVHASRVWVRVESISPIHVEPWAKFNRNHREQWKSLPDPEEWAKAPYALFPAQGKAPDKSDAEHPAALAKPGLQWILRIGFEQRNDADLRQEEVDETLRWWGSFGGVGARTRRGLGAVRVEGLRPVTKEEAKAAGCELVIRNETATADRAWRKAIDKLKDFRQKPGFARNPVSPDTKRPGRSRWPEADAIRRITGRHAPNHAPNHAPEPPAGNVFPRAAFGLPIIFHFKDKDDPADHSLQAQGHDRLASPLILRPYPVGEQEWSAAALLLPHHHVDDMQLELKAGQHTEKIPAPYWQPDKAQDVPPIAPTQAQDALSAFLEFFQRDNL
jgi:CRISPR-associated protein Cmr1